MKCKHEEKIKKYGVKKADGTQEFFYICKKCRLVILTKAIFNMDNVKKQ